LFHAKLAKEQGRKGIKAKGQRRKKTKKAKFLKLLNWKMHKLPSPFGEGLGMGFSNWKTLPTLNP
jgi:hypothetical protein